MAKRISPLSSLSIERQREIYQLFADQISDQAIAGRLQEWGLNLDSSAVGMERTIWRGNLLFFQEAMETVAQHRAAYPKSCDQPIVAVAADILGASALMLARQFHSEVATTLGKDEGATQQETLYLVEKLNRLAEGTYKVARARALVEKFAVELPLKMPKELETKEGINSEFVGEVFKMLRLMPD
jgi:hypothetical protein